MRLLPSLQKGLRNYLSSSAEPLALDKWSSSPPPLFSKAFIEFFLRAEGMNVATGHIAQAKKRMSEVGAQKLEGAFRFLIAF